jgi:hypothetical protein
MVDISSLGNLNAAEPLDMEIYPDAAAPTPLPTAGRYTVRAPETFPSEAFGSTKAGFLSAQVDPTIVGPDHEGYTIRFTKVSAKPFKRRGVTVSQLGDYLRATGKKGLIPSDPQSQADAVAETTNSLYQIDLDWRVYEKTTGWQLEGMKNFPSDGNGGHVPLIPSPTEKNEDGTPAMLRANAFVTRFVGA